MLEFVLALFDNVRQLSQIVAIIGALVFALVLSSSAIIHDTLNKELRPKFWRIVRTSAVWLACLAALACVPGIEDMWKVRIGLIKYQLASPANLGKAVDTIERIGHKLECKYIGCEEPKKEDK